MSGSIDVLVRYGYAVVFGWVLAEQIGLPIPAVPVLLAAGALAGTGRLNLVLVLALAVVASLVSDVTHQIEVRPHQMMIRRVLRRSPCPGGRGGRTRRRPSRGRR